MVSSEPLFKRVAVIGLGLIGGSLASAIRRNGLADTVVGADQRQEELQLGKELGVIDQAATAVSDAVRGADLVVLAVPVRATRAVLEQIRPALEPDAILTDVGSTKSSFVNDVEAVFGSLTPRVIPGHPIAGSEKSGIRAANPELFANHKVILTPPEDVSQPHLARLRALWEGCGATVLTMSVAYHDEVLAATSHLPHLIAFSLVDTLAGEDENMDIFRYAAGGFRDFTRIAASDPVMWHDIFLSNRDAVLRVIDHFTHDLEQLRTAIADQDSATLRRGFRPAPAAPSRRAVPASGGRVHGPAPGPPARTSRAPVGPPSPATSGSLTRSVGGLTSRVPLTVPPTDKRLPASRLRLSSQRQRPSAATDPPGPRVRTRQPRCPRPAPIRPARTPHSRPTPGRPPTAPP